MVWRVRRMESLTIRFGHVTGWWAGVGVPVAGLRAGVWFGIRVRVHRAGSKGSGRGRPVGGGSGVLRGAGVGDIVGEVDDGGALRLERRGFLG